jgi:predicted transcriptional regulator
MRETSKSDLIGMAAEIVSAYVANNSLPTAELPSLLQNVHDALNKMSNPAATEAPEAEERKPAVPIKKSVTDDYIISLENGQKLKSLKRHLMATYGMTPDQYRAKWNLPMDYPMVAPNYSKQRSALALSLGLGRKAATLAPAPVEPKAAPAKSAGKARKPRAKKAA